MKTTWNLVQTADCQISLTTRALASGTHVNDAAGIRGNLRSCAGWTGSIFAGITLAALLISGCSRQEEKDPRQQIPRVAVFKAEPSGQHIKAFTGVVEARIQSNLGFRVGGKIIERSVNMGKHVRKGDILMRLDSVDLKLSAEAQKANVEAAHARYVLAKTDEARLSGLVKSGAISHQAYDQAKAALDSAKADLNAAEALARVSDNSSSYAVLLADADGVIVSTLSEPGQVVAAGQTVIKLAHDGPREALINLPEGLRPEIGASALAELYGQPNESTAQLRELSDSADPVTRTFEARYVLEGAAASSPLGSTVTIRLSTGKTPLNAVVVPIASVYDHGHGPGVWIVDGTSAVKFRPVTIAAVGQEEMTLSDGVAAGERVVALGAHLLHEGQAVEFNAEENIANAKF